MVHVAVDLNSLDVACGTTSAASVVCWLMCTARMPIGRTVAYAYEITCANQLHHANPHRRKIIKPVPKLSFLTSRSNTRSDMRFSFVIDFWKLRDAQMLNVLQTLQSLLSSIQSTNFAIHKQTE